MPTVICKSWLYILVAIIIFLIIFLLNMTKKQRNGNNMSSQEIVDNFLNANEYKEEINQSATFIEKLGFANEIIVQDNKENIPQNAVSIMANGMEVYIPFEELVDMEEERKRLEDEKKKVLSEIERASKMLSNPGFVNKAPEAKINEEKAKLAKYQDMLKSIEERLKVD